MTVGESAKLTIDLEVVSKLLDAEINYAMSRVCVAMMKKDKNKGDAYMILYDALVGIKKQLVDK